MAKVEVQYGIAGRDRLPGPKQFQQWVEAALEGAYKNHEVSIRIVDETESATLNQTFRHRSGPTNVLSFPFEPPAAATIKLLGDIAVCAPVVEREAKAQGKSLEAHWAHMIVHGVLHLLGFDHTTDQQAAIMEQKEIRILDRLGVTDPYTEIDRQ